MKTFIDGEILLATDLNNNFTEVTQNATPIVKTCPISDGWTNQSGGNGGGVRVVKQGGLLVLTGRVYRSGNTTGAWTASTIAIIPEGARPVHSCLIELSGAVFLSIETTGEIKAYSGGQGITKNQTIHLNGITIPAI